MKLIFFRHGIAASKSPFQSEMDDFRRELTHDGIIESKEMVQHCRFIFKDADVIFSSPLVRALHTAQIVSREFPQKPFELMPSLDKLCDPKEFIREIKNLDIKRNYCFVGHEPHLTESIQLLLFGSGKAVIGLSKSGVVVLEGKNFDDLKVTFSVSPKSLTKICY